MPSPIDYAPGRSRPHQGQPRPHVGRRAVTIKPRLDALLGVTKADELMVTTMIFDHAARKHSYELLAQAFDLDAG